MPVRRAGAVEDGFPRQGQRALNDGLVRMAPLIYPVLVFTVFWERAEAEFGAPVASFRFRANALRRNGVAHLTLIVSIP